MRMPWARRGLPSRIARCLHPRMPRTIKPWIKMAAMPRPQIHLWMIKAKSRVGPANKQNSFRGLGANLTLTPLGIELRCGMQGSR